ncbi:hypothetical protein GCM10025880_09130 [Methylorubrum aminovorans]|nr:hypothetical protein GCM10025880_09130 [Methylorubrum aminovorans]
MTHPTDLSTRDAQRTGPALGRALGPCLDRRRLIGGAAAGAALALLPGRADAQAAAPALPASGSPFSDATVPDLARALGNRAFVAPTANDMPDPLKNLSREAYEAIRLRPEALLWGGEPHGFAVEPLLRGFYYTDRVALFLVEDGVVRPVTYARGSTRRDRRRARRPCRRPSRASPACASARGSASGTRISRCSRAPASTGWWGRARNSASTGAP